MWSTKNSTIGTAILEETRVGKKTCACQTEQMARLPASSVEESLRSGLKGQSRAMCRGLVPLPFPTSSTRLKMLQPPEKPHPSQREMTL